MQLPGVMVARQDLDLVTASMELQTVLLHLCSQQSGERCRNRSQNVSSQTSNWCHCPHGDVPQFVFIQPTKLPPTGATIWVAVLMRPSPLTPEYATIESSGARHAHSSFG